MGVMVLNVMRELDVNVNGHDVNANVNADDEMLASAADASINEGSFIFLFVWFDYQILE
jgi:hypothetical protein